MKTMKTMEIRVDAIQLPKRIGFNYEELKQELEAKVSELKKDLFFLLFQHATNQLDNPVKIAAVKKDIARIKTIIREKTAN